MEQNDNYRGGDCKTCAHDIGACYSDFCDSCSKEYSNYVKKEPEE